MYIHPINSWENEAEIIDFIQKNAFATLVTQSSGRPLATHIPFVLHHNSAGSPVLTGHIAKANPQWKDWDEHKDALVIFQGPHAYISSSWYNHENVPTWNYLVVHVYGKVRIIHEEELNTHLRSLVDVYESGRTNRVRFETMSESFVQSHIRALIGFEIHIDEVHASAKLSQNRDDINYHHIVQQLEKSSSPMDKEIAVEMRRKRGL
jgi:transcriptional regulator